MRVAETAGSTPIAFARERHELSLARLADIERRFSLLMTSEPDATVAGAYLAKATSFLRAAEAFESDDAYQEVLVSLCAISGIAAASAIITAREGAKSWGQHDRRVTELRKLGEPRVAKSLEILLSLKNPAQYHPRRLQRNAATRCLEAAGRLHERAVEVVQRGQ